MSALVELAAALEPALAGQLRGDRPEHGEFEATVAPGHRAFVIEAIREGYLLHYEHPRLFGALDDDLRLLGGDALFALGLERLAERGDLEAVVELSRLIAGSARAVAEGRREAIPALWRASAEQLGPPRPQSPK